MQIDTFTVVVLGLAIRALLACLFAVFWLNDRRSIWFAWWSAAFFVSCGSSAVFAVAGLAHDFLSIGIGTFLSIGIGTALLYLAFGCFLQGARAFEGRKPIWAMLAVVPAIWLSLCLIPAFLESVAPRVVLSSLILAGITGMTTYEFWRGRESLPSRWAVIVIFGWLSLFFGSRIAFVGLLPFPFGALPMEPAWVTAFNLAVFFPTLVLTVLIVSLTKERLELEQRTKAQTDPLTGALNRRAFMTQGTRVLLRHQLSQTPLCLLFIDIDHFKSFNDRFGHSGGDDVLTKFVETALDSIRPTDLLFRIGGEEFCCLLPETRAEQAHLVAERIRHRLANDSISVAGKSVRMTVSIGLASAEMFGYDIDALMRNADAAVYTAKRQGRNRVVVATMDRDIEEPSAATPRAAAS